MVACALVPERASCPSERRCLENGSLLVKNEQIRIDEKRLKLFSFQKRKVGRYGAILKTAGSLINRSSH